MFNIRVEKSPIHGRGVFANMLIEEGAWQFLYGYLAVIAPEDPRAKYCFMWDEADGGQVYVPYGPFCFLNHSEKPNCTWWQSWDEPDHVGEAPMIYIAANRDIEEDEELTIDYGYNPKQV